MQFRQVSQYLVCVLKLDVCCILFFCDTLSSNDIPYFATSGFIFNPPISNEPTKSWVIKIDHTTRAVGPIG
jgi:hypothetical protein